MKADMPLEIEAMLTRMGVDPQQVAQVDIRCDAQHQPEITVVLRPDRDLVEDRRDAHDEG